MKTYPILFFRLALIELLDPIALTESIQPVKLPTDCGIDALEREIEAVSAGLGRVNAFDQNTAQRLRHTGLVTKPTSECLREPIRPMDAFAIICANITDGRSVSHGDSGRVLQRKIIRKDAFNSHGEIFPNTGGPLIRASDSALLGVVSFGYPGIPANGGRGLQVFAFVPHYYKWIAHVTGLEVPVCELPQAIVF